MSNLNHSVFQKWDLTISTLGSVHGCYPQNDATGKIPYQDSNLIDLFETKRQWAEEYVDEDSAEYAVEAKKIEAELKQKGYIRIK